MQLDVNRFFSARLVYDEARPEKLRVTNSFWDWVKRVVSWIWSPASYSNENRRAIALFKKCLVNTLGPERLQRICTRYSLDLDRMEKKGNPLLSRHVSQIVIGAKNISVEDINEFIHKTHEAGLPDPRFADKNSFQDLDKETLAGVIASLSQPFADHWQVPDIKKRITGRPTDWLARIFYDPFLADRERIQVSRENPKDTFKVFIHNMAVRVIKREMDVGTLIPAPNHPDGSPQFYYVSAKVVTGEGMVSYLFHPATHDTSLNPIRGFRGTSGRNSEIDGISTLITDLEKDLGRSAYESGLIYEPRILEKLVQPKEEFGHSLGGAIVQYRVTHLDHIETAQIHSSPGIPEKDVEIFNKKRNPVHLIIDRPHEPLFGQVHLGYKAPPNVKVDFTKYRVCKKKLGYDPHVAVWGRETCKFEVEKGFTQEQIDRHFFHKNHLSERTRSILGPLFAKILRGIRKVCRHCFSSRAQQQLGLKIGTMQNGKWQVDHFRPI